MKEDDPLFMENGLLIFEMERGGALFAHRVCSSFRIVKLSESSASRIV